MLILKKGGQKLESEVLEIKLTLIGAEDGVVDFVIFDQFNGYFPYFYY